jgi:aspartyl-tRNA(Asn)/glutamyl-tRNA(Gln) amidotransferase subunit A
VHELSAETRTLWSNVIRTLQSRGAQIVDVSLPHTRYALPAYYMIACAEASSNLARYSGIEFGAQADSADGIESLDEFYELTRSQGFGRETKRRILLGTFVLSRESYNTLLKKAQQVRHLVKSDFDRVYQSVDVLVTPTTTGAAQPIAHVMAEVDPVQEYVGDIMTIPASLAGMANALHSHQHHWSSLLNSTAVL